MILHQGGSAKAKIIIYYLFSDNTMVDEVSPCIYGISPITARSTHKATACEKIIDRERDILQLNM